MNIQNPDRSFAVTFYKYAGQQSEANFTYRIKVGHQLNMTRTFYFDKNYEGPDHDLYIYNGVLNLKKVIDGRYRKLIEPVDSSMVSYGIMILV